VPLWCWGDLKNQQGLNMDITRRDFSFEQLETQLRDQLQRMLGPGGFNRETDILAITVNRWSHGYAYFSNSLYDDADESEKLMNLARQPVGRVSIANSDAAYRAVGEVG